MTSFTFDQGLVIRYANNGHRHVIPVSEIDDISVVMMFNLRHPILASIIVFLLIAFAAIFISKFGLSLGSMMWPRGGVMLLPFVALVYLTWSLINLRKIPWIVVIRNGVLLELPLEGISKSDAESVIAQVKSALSDR